MRYSLIGIIVSLVAACSSAQKKDGAPAPASSPSPVASPAAAPSPSPKAAASPEPAPAGALETRCKQGSDERMMSIVPKGAGCELHYQKFGTNEVKASAINDPKYCETVRDRMRGNLEAAGFSCR